MEKIVNDKGTTDNDRGKSDKGKGILVNEKGKSDNVEFLNIYIKNVRF